jgi:Ser/Thr protein kinase RdoA (MazF antagonist)
LNVHTVEDHQAFADLTDYGDAGFGLVGQDIANTCSPEQDGVR